MHCTRLVTAGAGRKHRTAIPSLSAKVPADWPRARGDEVSDQESRVELRNSAVYRTRGAWPTTKTNRRAIIPKGEMSSTGTEDSNRRSCKTRSIPRTCAPRINAILRPAPNVSLAVNHDTKYLLDQPDQGILLPLLEPVGRDGVG